MKNIPVVGFILLASAIFFFGCNAPASKNAPTSTGVVSAAGAGTGRIAYVNIDTLEANYELLKSKREQFKSRQEQMEGELERSYQQMQTDAEEVQKKAQANNLTQTEYEAAQKRLMQMRQSLETRKQSLSDQLMKEQDEFNKDLKVRLNAFLDDYNKNKHYDYILSYSDVGSSILYVNKQLDITKDVVDGMNATSKNDANQKNK
jgi:outer membrane protein